MGDGTGSATRPFADPAFDGDPSIETQEEVDEEGKPVKPKITVKTEEPAEPEPPGGPIIDDCPDGHRKYYFDGGYVDVVTHLIYELDPDGRQLTEVKFTDYTAERVRTLYRNAADLGRDWSDPAARAAIIEKLADRGVDFEELARCRRSRCRPVRPALPRGLQRPAAHAQGARTVAPQRKEGLLRSVRRGRKSRTRRCID